MTDIFNTGVCYLIGVVIPEGTSDTRIVNGFNSSASRMMYHIGKGTPEFRAEAIDLDPGFKWSLIGPAFSVTEEVARGLVEPHSIAKGKFKLYEAPVFGVAVFDEFIAAHKWTDTALESLYSAYKIIGVKEGDNQYLLRGDKNMRNNEEKIYENMSHDWNTTTVKEGDQMLRRDGNGGGVDTWEPFTVNETYLRLIIEFPDDYRHPDGTPVVLIPVI